MAITEEARFQLFEKLRKALGAEEAATLMEHLPPVGWGDVARQRDVDRLEVAMRSEVDRLEGTMHATFATKVDLELALRQQTNRYIGWMVASNATLVATVSLIVGLR
ncbi:MAG: hypothetical protein JWN67_3032 [Actinomycetia bacterium]|nr:hypothetical protein [Actinomycetes bacterium]